jgi:antitoxin VapB
MLTRATLLRSNGSQAVRLPKAIAFPETVREVVIVPDGPRRIIAPFDALGTELASRDQPAMQERKRF